VVLLIAALCAAFLAPVPAAAAELRQPASQTEPPRLFERSARQAIAIASDAGKVRVERREGRLEPTAYVKDPGHWQVSFFRDGDEVVQVLVDDSSGALLEQWTGHQIAWTMARGYEGAFGRKLNAPYIWLPLCALFMLPFLDLRRPFRLLHLDLAVMLAFGASHVFFNRGEIGVSVPLAYPVLVYLLIRVLLAGMRPRERPAPLVPHLPVVCLVIGLALLIAFRVGLNVIDSNVIDVGYAGVIGADRIVDGDPLYGKGFSDDVERGDTYGPVNYLSYVPFEQALPWSGRWDDLAAAHGAAIAFDLLVIVGLLLLGPRLRPGREGRVLGLALAYAWSAYPYTTFVLETNANDALVALFCVAAMLALTLRRERLSALVCAVVTGLGGATKFAPLALAPLFARRRPVIFTVALAVTLALIVLPFVPDGGLRELYDRTVGYQAGRPSPFSVWGQEPSLELLQAAVKAAAAGLALLVALVPRRRDARQAAALGAAVLIGIQLAATHWFYLYVVWFVPFVLVATFGAYRLPRRPAAAGMEPGRELVAR
jgi:archaellum component FlaG (FlaF/FlaG flagellin family)